MHLIKKAKCGRRSVHKEHAYDRKTYNCGREANRERNSSPAYCLGSYNQLFVIQMAFRACVPNKER